VIGFLYGSLTILVVVYAAKFMIYGVRAANASLRSVGSNLGEAGAILGAGRLTVIREIYAPLMGPGLLAGFIIVFIDTTKSLAIPLILGGNQFKIVQNTIWLFITQSELNVAAAYSVMLLGALTTVYLIAYKLGIDITSV
jgi:iron(III) transport system permease protein